MIVSVSGRIRIVAKLLLRQVCPVRGGVGSMTERAMSSACSCLPMVWSSRPPAVSCASNSPNPVDLSASVLAQAKASMGLHRVGSACGKMAESGHQNGDGSPRAVRQHRLGFLPAEDQKTGTCLYRARSAFGLPDKANADGSKMRRVLWIPRGFTIPLWTSSWDKPDEVLRVRIRRPKGDLKGDDPKYMLLTWSGQVHMSLPPIGVTPYLDVWVVVEVVLDAIAGITLATARSGVWPRLPIVESLMSWHMGC